MRRRHRGTQTARKNIFGREVSFTSFVSYHWNPIFSIEIMPFHFANNRIFEICILGKNYRINWTPKR